MDEEEVEKGSEPIDTAALRQMAGVDLAVNMVQADRLWRHAGGDLVAAADRIEWLERQLADADGALESLAPSGNLTITRDTGGG